MLAGNVHSLIGQTALTRWVHSFDSTSAFSSPVSRDLNQDGFPDIILGCGEELDSSAVGLVALNGRTGAPLWVFPSRSQLYTQPLFLDVNSDQREDVLIAGRFGQMFAVDGQTGEEIWSFFDGTNEEALDSGWQNFYSPVWIPDQNNDQIPEMLISNGGDPTKSPIDSMRPAGSLLVIDPMNGVVLARAEMPDGKETYFSPMLMDSGNDLDPWVIFGSGGETVRGDLWKIRLSKVMTGSLLSANSVLSGKSKGLIALPSLADLNQDGTLDFIIPRLDEALVAVDGNTNTILWTVSYPGHEFYLSPTIGQFTGDPTPDALVHVQVGNWPLYQGGFWILVDGATGQVVWTRTSATYQFASAMAVDADQDGWDEMLFVRNFFTDLPNGSRAFRHHIELYDFQSGTGILLSQDRDGMDVFSTPLLTDLDEDGMLDFIYASNNNTEGWYESKGITVFREELSNVWPSISWGGYLGNLRDGTYQIQVLNDLAPERFQEFSVLPDPSQQRLQVTSAYRINALTLYDVNGKMVRAASQSSLSLSGLAGGLYILQVETEGGVGRLKIRISPR